MKIKPYPKNAKKHPKDQIQKVANSIKEFGCKQPIVVDKDGEIIVGHGRYEAMKLLGYSELKETGYSKKGETFIPYILADDLSEEEIKAYRLADNKLNESEWDMDLVIPELEQLSMEMQELTGFKMEEIETGDNGNDWNYNYKGLDQVGDGLVEKLGFAPHSMWYDIPRDYGQIKDKLVRLPTRKNNGAHQDKYSRTNPESIRRIVAMYMREGDYFLENCCGWSTFGSIAKYFGYSGIGVDIWDTAIDLSKKQIEIMPGKGTVDILEMDGMELEFKDSHFDYVYCNPPFMDVEEYSGKPNDISTKNEEEFKSKFLKLMAENSRVLKKDGLCTVTMSDQRKNGILIPHQKMVIDCGLTAGLSLHDVVIVEQLGVANMYRKKAYNNRRSPKNHEYVTTFIKK